MTNRLLKFLRPRRSPLGWSSLGRLSSGWAVAFGAAVLAGCAANVGTTTTATSLVTPNAVQQPTVSAGPVKIALLLSLGGLGPSAAMSKAMKQAAELALFERDDPNIQLIVKDDQSSEEGAAEAATLAVADGAEIIIGPLLSHAVPGVARVARQSGVPVVALSNKASAAGSNVYLISFLVEDEVDRVISYAAGRGKRQFAALIPDTPYGRVAEAAFRQSVARVSGSIRILETYPANANGMVKPVKAVSAAVTRARDAGLPIDALFIPGDPDTLPKLGPVLTYAGLGKGIQLLGTGSWDDPGLGREKAFVGGWFAGPDPSSFAAFSERFTRTFGRKPPRLATLAYDAVGLSIALSSAPPGQRFTYQALTRPSGYIGVDGLIRLKPNGLPDRSFAVLEIQPYSSRVIDMAPTTAGNQQISAIVP